MRYRQIEQLSSEHDIRDLCELSEVSRSGYYAWRRRGETARETNNRRLVEEIKRLLKPTAVDTVVRALPKRYGVLDTKPTTNEWND